MMMMMMMMMMMLMVNCLCGMVDRRKVFTLISSRDHCQRSSPSRISDTPRAGFETAQNLSSGLVEWSCAVVITTTPPRRSPCRALCHDVQLQKNLTSRFREKLKRRSLGQKKRLTFLILGIKSISPISHFNPVFNV